MARKVSQSDPALAIEFWLSGFYTHRSQLFAPFKGIGVSVVSFHDPVIDGANMEDTDLYEWQRRPGFSIFCPIPLLGSEVVNQFYSSRDLNGKVTAFFDSTARLASFTNVDITPLIAKTTTAQGYITTVGNRTYFSDGAGADMQKWNSAAPLSAINPSAWGLAAPTIAPTLQNLGCWLPKTVYSSNNAILDLNGNIQVAFSTASGVTSQTQATTIFSSIHIPGSEGGFWEKDPHPIPGQHYWAYYKTPIPTYSDYAVWTGFGFSIPAGATITGISVTINKHAPASAEVLTDQSVKLCVAGAPTGVEHASGTAWLAVASNTSPEWGPSVYGSSTDMWGLSLTPAQVNAGTFGVAIAAKASGPAGTGGFPEINLAPYPVTIQIFYQLAAGPTGSARSGENEPTWNTTINSPTQDGTVIWTNSGNLLSWFPDTSYPLPAVVKDTNGNLQIAVTSTNPIAAWNASTPYAIGAEVLFGGEYWIATAASTGVAPSAGYSVATLVAATTTTITSWVQTSAPVTTGPIAPTWNTAIGGQTSDGDYTWTNLGQGSLTESFGTSYVFAFRTLYGHLTTASPASINTGSIFGPQSVGITAFSITSGVVTFTGKNNLIPGNTFTIAGLAFGTYLNGQTFVVLASGLSPTSFQANFTHADVGLTSDTGNTLPLIATVFGVGTDSLLCNSTATITAVGVTASIVTITAANNFVPGLYVTFTGATTATWLNNLQLQVVNVDPNGAWFQVYFVTPNYPTTAETGTATFNAVEIYRVSDGGGIYLFAGAVTNPGLNVPWTLNDFTTDSDLNEEQIAPLSHLNDPPPGAPGSSVNTPGTITAYWNGRIWMIVGNFVYFTAGPDCTNGIPEESWPPGNRFQFAGPGLGLEPTPDGVGLLVYLADRVGGILGGPETISFYPTDVLSNFGIANPNAVFRDGSTIGQFTTQKQYIDLVGGQKQETGEHIADYLTTHFKSELTYATMHRNGLDVGIFLSNGVDQVLRYGSNIGAWSVPAFPVGGAGALQSIETSVGVYSLMLAPPTGGIISVVGPSSPTAATSTGASEEAWTNPTNVTLNDDVDFAVASLGLSTTITGDFTFGVSSGYSAVIATFPAVTPPAAIAQNVTPTVSNNIQIPTSASAITKMFPAANTPGNSIVVPVLYHPDTGVPTAVIASVTDSNLNTYSKVVASAAGSNIPWAEIWRADIINASIALVVSSVSNGGGVTTYHGTFPEGTAGGLIGASFTVTGFLTGGNNVTFTAVNSTATTLVVLTTTQTDETHAAIATQTTNIVTVAFTVTGTAGPSILASMGLYELNALAATDHTNAVTNAGATTSPSAGPAIVSAANEFCLAVVTAVNTTDAVTHGVGWTAQQGADGFGTEYQIPNSVLTPHSTSQLLTATGYGFTIPPNFSILGLQAQIRGKQTVVSPTTKITAKLTIGGTVRTFNLTPTLGTATFGSSVDSWGLTITPAQVNAAGFGLILQASDSNTGETVEFDLSAAQITLWYTPSGKYLLARDLTTWADGGHSNSADGTPYAKCFVTVGSITLSQLGAPMFPLQHVVGYFDAVGTLNHGGPSYPDMWILPNEISDKAGIGFVYLPEIVQEPPVGQNQPSASMLALRWPLNMMNSASASQFIHHLQVKIQFEPENAPNTLKALSFKENQE